MEPTKDVEKKIDPPRIQSALADDGNYQDNVDISVNNPQETGEIQEKDNMDTQLIEVEDQSEPNPPEIQDQDHHLSEYTANSNNPQREVSQSIICTDQYETKETLRHLKIEGYKKLVEWNKNKRHQIAIIKETLTKLLLVYQKKNARNENRLNFVKAYFNSYIEDLNKFASHQTEFANKAIHSFETKDQKSMPLFEQGIYEMLNAIKNNDKKIQELKKLFDQSVLEPMNKGLTKHAEYYLLMERLTKHMDSYNEMYERSIKEYTSVCEIFNSSMDLKKKKKAEKDIYFETEKYASTLRTMFGVMKVTCDDMSKIQPLAVSKEDEYLKVFAQSFKQFGFFAQENFGSILASTLSKSKFIFESIDTKYSVEKEYSIHSILTEEDLLRFNVEKSLIVEEFKCMKKHMFDQLTGMDIEDVFSVYRTHAKLSSGSFISSYTACDICITIDGFICIKTLGQLVKQIVNEKIDKFSPDIIIKDTNNKNNRYLCILRYVKKGMIFDSKKEITISFDDDYAKVTAFKQSFVKYNSIHSF